MKTISVALAGDSYDVVIGANILDQVGARLAPLLSRPRAFILTDGHVGPALLDKMTDNLAKADIECHSYVIPAGEQSKSWQTLEQVTDWLLAQGVERSDMLVALGGGVIGDITGFAAAIVKRGCSFVQIPTSLLAQVDSSVGGKTAINSRAGKNLIGRFNQPKLVLIDPQVLGSLADRELRAGYAEVVKYGLINDANFFQWCEENGEAVLARDADALEHAIAHSVAAKAAIVAEDELELSGRRALLNLGHTFGHALEAESGYSDDLVHGEAVAAGMALAFHYSARRGHCPETDAARVERHLQMVGLPHDLASAGIAANGQSLVDHMLHDKKMTGGNLPFILARGIGQAYLADDVELKDIAAFLDETRQPA